MTSKDLTPSLEAYRQKYKHIRLTRQDGILEVSLHTDGGSLIWSPRIHEELGYCFADIAADPENKVVIITGEGSSFCTELDIDAFDLGNPKWAATYQEGKLILNNLLNIDVPVIGAVNGPAHIHAEILMLSNIVIAAEESTFQDKVHFTCSWVPGDGVHIFWPALLGQTRASYFLLTGQIIDAKNAHELGLVNEVVSRAELLPRARSIAAGIALQPHLVRRYTRNLLAHEMKRLMHDSLSHGLALEGLAFLENAKA